MLNAHVEKHRVKLLSRIQVQHFYLSLFIFFRFLGRVGGGGSGCSEFLRNFLALASEGLHFEVIFRLLNVTGEKLKDCKSVQRN